MNIHGHSSNKPHPYDEYRSLILAYISPRLSLKCGQMKLLRKFPFEGEWYDEKEVRNHHEGLRKRDRQLLLDLLLVFTAGITFLTVLLLIAMFLLV